MPSEIYSEISRPEEKSGGAFSFQRGTSPDTLKGPEPDLTHPRSRTEQASGLLHSTRRILERELKTANLWEHLEAIDGHR